MFSGLVFGMIYVYIIRQYKAYLIYRHFDYLFYLDFEASSTLEVNRNIVANLREFSIYLHQFGTYPVTNNERPTLEPAAWKGIWDTVAF